MQRTKPMDQDDDQILVLESEGLSVDSVNPKQKGFSESDDLINHIHKTFAYVDSFRVYTHYRHFYSLFKSCIVDFRQVKCITCGCNSENDICQAKFLYGRNSKFIFCLITEVTNRLQNALDSDVLNSSQPINGDILASKLAERKRQVQIKQQNLTADEFSTPSQSSVGLDASNISSINQTNFGAFCLLPLREPVQLQCGHRQCASCVENGTENTVRCRGFQRDLRRVDFTSLCNLSLPSRSYQDHFDQCHKNPVCEYCDEQFTSTDHLNLHKQNECRMMTMPCALEEYGCSRSVVRGEMEKHYLSEEHQGVLLNAIRRLSLPLPSAYHQNSNDSTIDPLQKISQSSSILADANHILEDTRRLFSASIDLQNSFETVMKEVTSLKSSVEEQNIFLHQMISNQEILKRDIESISQKLESAPDISCDGTMVWKITNVIEKMADAQSERQTSIYSPIFYSSPTGYKMRLCLYLDGDGNARRTHMSLFFVLMRGEYDAILQFPFNYKVTFCLLDQTASQRHIIDSFRPDVKSNSFQRPRSDMNIASGIPKFAPLAMFDGDHNPYVQDNAMFIKVMVDFLNIPRRLWPEVFRINPALPIHRQHDTVREMVDRYQRRQLIRHIEASCDAYQIDRSTVYLSPPTTE